jgi:hypothetical protein
MVYPIDGTVADLDTVYASTDLASPEFTPGTSTKTSNNGEYIFLQAASTAVKGRWGVIGPTNTWTPVTTILANQGSRLAVAHTSVAGGSYGWFPVAGLNIEVFNGSAAWAAGGPVFLDAAQAGVLTSVTASLEFVQGVRIPSLAASTTGTVDLAYPTVTRYTG